MYKFKAISIKFNPIMILLFALLIFSGCKREMVNEIISETPPELSVIVYKGADKNVRISGASVKLYASEADRTNDQNLIFGTTTNDSGEAVFSKDNFRKGVLYVKVTKDAATVLAVTPYLLQNDGKTLFWVAQN